MSNWLHRVGALFGGRADAAPVMPAPAATPRPRTATSARPAPARAAAVVPPEAPARAAAPVASVTAEAPASDAMPDITVPFFEWVLDCGAVLQTSLHDSEQAILAKLDTVLASDSSRSTLLPRAPAVIPQLLNSLRDDKQPVDVLAQRVTRDPHLVAEVIRMANSVQTRAAEPVTEIAEAISRLGSNGLRRAISRVLLKPMFDSHADSLSARCAPRLWQHSDAKANACQREAAARGLDPFEGYLAGLMHNIGWTAALRAIDRSGEPAPTSFSRAFVSDFERRRENFFGLLVMSWQLTDGLTALGVELLDGSLASARSPLGQALHAADAQAALEMLGGASLLDAIAPAAGGVTH